MAQTAQMIFRSAKIEDMQEMRKLIQEFADYAKMGDSAELSEEDLIRDAGLTGEKAVAHYYLLELLDEVNQKPKLIALAVCCISYSSWKGKTYLLDNFYVRPEYGSIGASERLFREIAAKALEHGCKRLDTNVLAWDPARKFYENMGAVNNTEAEQRHYYRLHEKEIHDVQQQLEAQKNFV